MASQGKVERPKPGGQKTLQSSAKHVGWSVRRQRIKRRAKTTVLCTIKSARKQGFFSKMTVKGTKFQLKVWKYLKSIKKGTVKTYKDVAIAIKSPKSARAVANACAKNPYAPKIPCHRVIKSDGSLGGYSRVASKTSIRFNNSMTRYFWSIRVFCTCISYCTS